MFGTMKESGDLYKLLETVNSDSRAIVFYSERDIYYQYFEGYIRFLQNHSDLNIYYITSDKKDRVLQLKSDRFHPFHLDKLLPKAIENLKTKAIVMTVQGLGNSFLKRSKFGGNHIFLCHSMCSMHLNYNLGDLDHYDTVMCVGPHQTKEIIAAEKLYGLKQRKLVDCGYWWVENLYREGKNATHDRSILVAPSWHEGNFFDAGLDEALPGLASLGVPVILRPHPEFAKRYPQKIDSISKKIRGTANIKLEPVLSKPKSVMNAELLITDYSGICFEFSIGLERPVLFINSKPRVDNSKYKDIPIVPIEYATRKGVLGDTIEMNELSNISEKIQGCIKNQNTYREKLPAVRQEYLYNWLHSDETGGKYLLSLYDNS